MILRSLLFVTLIFPLFLSAAPRQKNISTKLEVGLFFPNFLGTISNTKSSSDFEKDYGYNDTIASFFSMDVSNNYTYVPNLYISYFNMKDNSNKTLKKSVTVADENYNADVATDISYSVLNLVLLKDIKKRGEYFSLFNSNYYSGDLEFSIGVNAKIINWEFQILDKSDLSRSPSWITAGIIIPLPYLGFKYYIKDFILYSNASALSFSSAKSTSYQYGIDYKIVDSLYLSAGYIYEKFKAVEKSDTISFISKGYKFSFKYAF